jgi:hypothetical protein
MTRAAWALAVALLAGCVDPGRISPSGGDGGGKPDSPTGDDGPGTGTSWGAEGDALPGSDTPIELPDGSTCFEGQLTPFHGDLHVHLADHETPQVCNDSAAEVIAEAAARGLGFVGITEHVWRTTAAELTACEEAALASVTDTFRPSCGFETNVVMADGSYSGHANALWSRTNHDVDTSDADGEDFTGASGKQDFEAFVDAHDAVGQINHPNHEEDGWPDRAATYASDAIDLVELNGGCGGCDDRDARAIRAYAAFLDAGWRIGPTMDSDTHCKKPGRRTGAWVAGSIVKRALRNHRTFVQSYEPPAGADNELGLFMRKDAPDRVHACWMGSSLARPDGGVVTLRLRLRGHLVTAAAPGSIAVAILARDHGEDAPLATATCGADGPCTCDGDTCTWEPEVMAADTDWLVAHAQADVEGMRRWAVSAPVWLF